MVRNKPVTCKWCKSKFVPERAKQICCSPECAIEYGLKQRAKAERIAGIEDRKVIKAKKEKLKTRSDYIKEAQIAVNSYVRERDKDKGCISCGTSLQVESVGGGFDAGHYRSRGSSPSLRFDERNIHGQCKRCNRYLSGNYSAYRTGLESRYGSAFVVALDSDNEIRKHTIDELKAIKALYVAKLKGLKCKN